MFTQRFQVSDAIVMWPARGLELGDKVGMCPPNVAISNLQSLSGYFISSSGSGPTDLFARGNPLVKF